MAEQWPTRDVAIEGTVQSPPTRMSKQLKCGESLAVKYQHLLYCEQASRLLTQMLC